MKRLIVLTAACLLAASCKNDIEPITGYNSKIEINNITLSGVSLGAGVRGYLIREYLIDTDTTPVTDNYTDSFDVTGNGYNQQFHFNTPDKAIKCDLQVRLKVINGTASSAAAESFLYYRNDETIFAETPLEFSGSIDNFYSATHTVTF